MNKSIKIAHISDVHIRSLARHKEHREAFEEFFERMRQEKPDFIVNTGDLWHTKTQNISPEMMRLISWVFQESSKITTTITILGNHDGALSALHRDDAISPIHDMTNAPNSYLYRESGSHIHGETCFHIFSVFDKKGWQDIKPKPGYVNIALFHGTVAGSKTDLGWELESDLNANFFEGFDFVLLGDIHKQQTIASRPNKNGVEKPYISFAGSFLQNNFGEDLDKGYLLWNIRSKDDWDVDFHSLTNRYPFITIPYQGSVQSTYKTVRDVLNKQLQDVRIRISSEHKLSSVEKRRLNKKLRAQGAETVLFKDNSQHNSQDIETNGVRVSKTSLRKDPEAVLGFYEQFLKAKKYHLSEKQKEAAKKQIRIYLDRLNTEEADVVNRNIHWSIQSFEFNNLFRYNEDNNINFQNLEGIVGILGRNMTGKSSIIGSLMYSLYNSTDRGPVKNAHIINKNKNWADGKVRLNIDEKQYEVHRTTKRMKSKVADDKSSTALSLHSISQNEAGEDVYRSENNITRNDTDNEVRKLIGSAEDFMLTSLANNDNLSQFFKEGPTKRKQVLSKFLELDIFEKLYGYVKEDCNQHFDAIKDTSLDEIKQEIRQLKQERKETKEELKLYKADINNLNREKDKHQMWLHKHENAAAEVNLKEYHALDRKIDELQREIDATEKDKFLAQDNHANAKKKLEEAKKQKHDINVKQLQKDLEAHQKLKSSLQEMKHAIEMQNSTIESQAKSIRKLDQVPCGDMFPSCMFIRDSHQAKKEIEQEKQLLKQQKQQQDKLVEQIEVYAGDKIQEQLDLWSKLSHEEMKFEHEIEKWSNKSSYYTDQIVRLEEDINAKKKYKQELSKKIDFAESTEFSDVKKKLNETKKAISQNEQEQQKLFLKLGSCEEKLKNGIVEKDEFVEASKQFKIYESIQQAFSKNGIPAIVLKSQLPIINQELDRILGGVVDFKIELETDTNSNAMDVYIEDAHSRRVIELVSGMEKTIASLAIRVALINLSALPKSDIFILDEVWNALDGESFQKCMDFMSSLRSYFKTIIMITHIDEVKEIADRIIEISNDGLDSHINV